MPENLFDVVVDEVSLEGLDGITLEGLWQRLSIRLGIALPFKLAFMEQIWNTCLCVKGFSYYELQQPRDKLVIFDQYESEYLNFDTASGKEQQYKEIYPYCPIEDVENNIKGSCSTYHTRIDISNSVKEIRDLSTILKYYEQKLIIVASQELREQALISENVNPLFEIQLVHYCLLEKIGRSRYLGEVTLNKNNDAKEDSKALYYYRKVLQNQGFIKKQIFSHRNTENRNYSILLHLPRFFSKRKPKVIVWAESLINYLKSKENYAAEYNEVKSELGIDYCLKKFFKLGIFQNVFKSDLKVPYRSYYTNCDSKEWHTKGNPAKEKLVRVLALVDPNIQISDFWSSEEVNEEDETVVLNQSFQKFKVPFMKQVINIVASRKDRGISQMELAAEMGLTKLTSRSVVRNLVKSKAVTTYLVDEGRQRTTKYLSEKYNTNNGVRNLIDLEIFKLKEYQKLFVGNAKNDQISAKNLPKNNKKSMSKESDKNLNKQAVIKRNDAFKTVNAILRKYGFKKYKNYRFTSLKNLNIVLQHQKSIIQTTAKSPGLDYNLTKPNVFRDVEVKLTIAKPGCSKNLGETTGFLKELDNSRHKLSYRILLRANMILQVIKENKVIDDLYKLIQIICKYEEEKGYENRIDKVSLLRILHKLADDNLVKFVRISLISNLKEKSSTFIYDPRLAIDDMLIQAAIEQAKNKFCMTECQVLEKSKSKDCQRSNFDIANDTEHHKIVSMRPHPSIGKKYGYCPKFIRMRHIHVLLNYLVYRYSGRARLSKNELLNYFSEERLNIDFVLERDIPVYTTEVCWKMFIPPLPKHKDWPAGWTLMSDIICRMPLSIFIKVHNVSSEISGFDEYLKHPIKQHLLVKDLPLQIRKLLFTRRKYIFSIHEIITRLSYIGLVQFGPQKFKDKDQVFIYVNKRTELLDTTSSAAGYHKVEDKTYPATKFEFSSLPIVENYWYEMWNICINTCLGGRSVVEGKDILLEDLGRKIEMIQASKPKDIHEAEIYDNGFVPGDRKGAAGIDSAFFSHLKRNWNWPTSNQVGNRKTNEENKAQKIQKAAAKNNRETQKAKKKSSSNSKSAALNTKQPVEKDPSANSDHQLNNKEQEKHSKSPENNNASIIHLNVKTKKPAKIVRKVLPRKPNRKRVKYDEIDYTALQKMDKLRVDWHQNEDNILLVCKVAMMYLCPNPRRNLVSFIAIRDILRSYSFVSYNKTSRACQRRLLYMLKQKKTLNSVLLGVEELKQDYFVNKRFNGILDKIRSEYKDPAESDEKIAKVFKDLVFYIAKKYYNLSNIEYREPMILPKTIQEFNVFYKLKLPTKSVNANHTTKDLLDINDIHTATINSVIHSSMCCGKDRRSWAYQLFKVYQQYPEYLLRNAMMKIRSDQMVIMKKNYMCTYKKFGNCMPMSSSQYQLSSTYFYKFQMKWPYEIFSESYDTMVRLLNNYSKYNKSISEVIINNSNESNGIEILPVTGGTIGLIHDYLGDNKLNIDIEIPDQVIMLDPRLPQKDEVYQRIAKRFQDILASLSTEFVNLDKLNDTIASNNLQKCSLDYNNIAIEKQGTKRHFNEHDYCNENTKRLRLEVSNIENSDLSHNHLVRNVENNCDIEKTSESIQEARTEGKNPVEHYESDKTLGEPMEEGSSELTVQMENNIDKFRVDTFKASVPGIGWQGCVNDVKTRQTRIAMLKMREELHDLTFHDSHHAHEYFVVNSCKLFYSLNDDFGRCFNNETINYQGLQLPKEILPFDINVINEVISNIKEYAIIPKSVASYEDFRNEVLEKLEFNWSDIDNICNFISNGQEFGALLDELAEKFYYLGNTLSSILSLLQVKRIVLRVGVTHVRYIHKKFANPWVIHSYKILRLDKENHVAVPEGSVYILENRDNNYPEKTLASKFFGSSKNVNLNHSEEITFNENVDSQLGGDQLVNHENNQDRQSKEVVTENLPQKRLKRKRTILLEQKDVYRAAKLLDFNTAEEIKVVIKPWIRVDGALNRRVLDRMLGAILCYCNEYPGIFLSKVQIRFSPALQPYHTRELVEILEKLGCLTMTVQKSAQVTLFSRPTHPDISGIPDLTGRSSLIVLSTTMDSTLRFGLFLSNRSYSLDFLSSL